MADWYNHSDGKQYPYPEYTELGELKEINKNQKQIIELLKILVEEIKNRRDNG